MKRASLVLIAAMMPAAVVLSYRRANVSDALYVASNGVFQGAHQAGVASNEPDEGERKERQNSLAKAVLHSDKKWESLAASFDDFPVGRCGWKWSKPGEHSFSGQTHMGPGFAGALKEFLQQHLGREMSVLRELFTAHDDFLTTLLEAVEFCDYPNMPFIGPRAALEMVVLIRPFVEQDVDLRSPFNTYVRNFHRRWTHSCSQLSSKEAMPLEELTSGKRTPEAFPDDESSFKIAFENKQLVVHMIGDFYDFTPFLEKLATDTLTAMSTCLFAQGKGNLLGIMQGPIQSGYPFSFLFDGPSMDEHGFLVSNSDIMTINRLSLEAAEEACIGAMHKVPSRYRGRGIIFKKVPNDVPDQQNYDEKCVHTVSDFMQASRGVENLGQADGPDTHYSEYWFPHGSLKGAVGVFFDMSKARAIFRKWEAAELEPSSFDEAELQRIREQKEQLYRNIEVLHTMRAQEKFSALGDKLLIQAQWREIHDDLLDNGTQMELYFRRPKEMELVILGTTTWRIPSAAELEKQFKLGTVNALDLRHLPNIVNFAKLWPEYGANLVEGLRYTNVWHDIFDKDVEMLEAQARL